MPRTQAAARAPPCALVLLLQLRLAGAYVASKNQAEAQVDAELRTLSEASNKEGSEWHWGVEAGKKSGERYGVGEKVKDEVTAIQAVRTKEGEHTFGGYSSNPICNTFRCINPLFPGIDDIPLLEGANWQCQPFQAAQQYLNFCKQAVNYEFLLPSPNSTRTLHSVVMEQDNVAATMYFYHLAGLNVEAWDHQRPEVSDDPCAQAVWRLVCATYFPRAPAGCSSGSPGRYLRPCSSTCNTYIRSCNVECCDESTRCVFTNRVELANGGTRVVRGYDDHDGPSRYCTGGAAPRVAAIPALAALLALFAVAPQWLL